MTSSALLALSWLCFSAVFIPSANGQGNGAVILYRNGGSSISYSSGIVRIRYNSYWGNICYDSSFGSTEATVICQQLGYTGASSYSSSGLDTSYGTDSAAIVLDDIYCSSSSYLMILQCSFSSYIDSGCIENYDDVTVSCYTTRIWDNPYTGQIRLNGTQYANRGLIEVYCNGQWGTICDDGFNSNAADTVCIQLGYNDYYTYDTETYQGLSSQPIWLANVYCSYDYSCLSSCATCPASEVTYCSHSEDVDITCEYSSSSNDYGSSLYTCDFDALDDLVGLIVGITIAVFVVIVALSVGIPICICCCIGVGVGAAVRSSNTPRVVTATTTGTSAAVTSTVATQQGAGPPHVHTTSAYYPAAPGAYPAQPVAPQPGFENKPPPYPQQGQGGYPMQEYPPKTY